LGFTALVHASVPTALSEQYKTTSSAAYFHHHDVPGAEAVSDRRVLLGRQVALGRVRLLHPEQCREGPSSTGVESPSAAAKEFTYCPLKSKRVGRSSVRNR
jgi:hypothetical protein